MSLKRTLATVAGAAVAVLLAACGNATPITSGTPTPAPTITPFISLEIKTTTAAAQPGGIATGPDQALWFTETGADKIGHINSTAQVTEYPVTTANAAPLMITNGPNGQMWFTESGVPQVAEIALAGGQITEFNLQMPAARPWGIANGPDGAMWVTDPGANGIWRITTNGTPTFYPLATPNAKPTAITFANNGAMFFLESGADKIGTLATTAVGEAAPSFTPAPNYVPPTEYPVTPGSGLGAIAQGSDGALWFTEPTTAKLGRMTTTGVLSSETALTGMTKPFGIVLGSDNNFYITDVTGSQVGQYVVNSAKLNLVKTPTPNAGPYWIALGPDLEIYFTEQTASQVGQFRYF